MARRGLWLVVVGVLVCGLLGPVRPVLAGEPPQSEEQPVIAWTASFGGGGHDHGAGVAVDDVGNVYTTGTVRWGDPDTYPAVFVWKLDVDGNLVWAKAMGGPRPDSGLAVALDSAGNVVVAGSFRGVADFDPGPDVFHLSSAGRRDVFVVKLDPDGNLVWAKALGGRGDDEAYGLAVDGSDNVYSTGFFRETADFDPGPAVFDLSSAGGEDVFVSRLDVDGDFVWAKAMGGSGSGSGRGIAVDGAGNVHTTGGFSGTIDFDPGPGVFNLAGDSWADVFVSKLDGDGNFVWAKAMGGPSGDVASGVAVDGAGGVYTTGDYRETADFDPGPGIFNLTSPSDWQADVFVSKLDANGDFVWAGSLLVEDEHNPPGSAQAGQVTVDTGGNVYTTGWFSGRADFDPGPGVQEWFGGGGYAWKVTGDGHFVWVASLSGIGGRGIAVDRAKNTYTIGWNDTGKVSHEDIEVVKLGNPAAWCAGLNATIVGTPGVDVIDGTPGPDVIAALDGDDVVNGNGGDDVICGGRGDDELRGDRGRDVVLGQAGADRVWGGPHGDELNGGHGSDHLVGGGGPDLLEGGNDDDRLDGNSGGDTLRGGPGLDRLNGGPGPDQCFGEIIKNC